MSKNSFKELESLIINDRGTHSEVTKQNVQSNIIFIKFLGDIFELYGPNVVKVLQSISHVNNNSVKQNDTNSSTNNTFDL